MDKEDRRAQGIARVPVERIVEICGRDARVPAFEAESVEVSGRGMHVRTPYLPELGAPLVCRLEERGREIVVEGIVAWRSPTDGGGEFGVRFTALDSGSVETLRDLCGLAERTTASAAADPDVGPTEPEANAAPAGAPVKLHIDGLAAPMKARVRRDSGRRVHVGSNLEFLKVGRTLQIEDVELRNRKGARIDSVSIALDPESQVPQLVVTLRYDGVDECDVTPEPSVIGAVEAGSTALDEGGVPRARVGPKASTGKSEAEMDFQADVSDDDDYDDDDSEFRGRLEGLATGASKAARATGSLLSRAGVGAAATVGSLFRKASEKVGEIRVPRGPAKRRVTARAPAVSASTTNRRLRPQGSARDAIDEGPAPSRKKWVIGGIAGTLGIAVLAGAASWLSGEGDSKEAALPGAEAPVALAPAPPAPSADEKKAAPEAPKTSGGIIADVPLFGPTPMATLEPAPLEPPPGDGELGDDESEDSAGAPDEAFEPPVTMAVAPVAAVKAEPEKPVQPWGTGRLHLPFVHRIKMDGVGVGLEGTKKSNGFSVFLPKRKLLETGKAIARRDDRIVDVRTSNEPGGARITFVFQGKVPAYKVRVKNNYVEFFVSSPQKS